MLAGAAPKKNQAVRSRRSTRREAVSCPRMPRRQSAGVVSVANGALDGLSVRRACRKGFPGGPEGIDDVGLTRPLGISTDGFQFAFDARRQMAGCSDQRLRERLFAPRFTTNEELNHETVKGAYRLGARMGVGEFGAAAGLVDQAFWLESVTNQGDRQNPHQRPVAIVIFVPTAGLLGRRARLEAIKSRFGGVADVEDNSRLVIWTVQPAQKSFRLVRQVESRGEQRIQESEHQPSIVTPRSGGLTMRSLVTPGHHADLAGRRELIGNAERIADQVTPHGPGEACHFSFRVGRVANVPGGDLLARVDVEPAHDVGHVLSTPRSLTGGTSLRPISLLLSPSGMKLATSSWRVVSRPPLVETCGGADVSDTAGAFGRGHISPAPTLTSRTTTAIPVACSRLARNRRLTTKVPVASAQPRGSVISRRAAAAIRSWR